MKREIKVFVIYQYTRNSNNFGFGNTTQFYTHRTYISPKEIREMEAILKKENDFKSVVILNYRVM